MDPKTTPEPFERLTAGDIARLQPGDRVQIVKSWGGDKVGSLHQFAGASATPGCINLQEKWLAVNVAYFCFIGRPASGGWIAWNNPRNPAPGRKVAVALHDPADGPALFFNKDSHDVEWEHVKHWRLEEREPEAAPRVSDGWERAYRELVRAQQKPADALSSALDWLDAGLKEEWTPDSHALASHALDRARAALNRPADVDLIAGLRRMAEVLRAVDQRLYQTSIGPSPSQALLDAKMVEAAIARLTLAEAPVTDDLVERATMKLLGKDVDSAPGINWQCNRQWTVNTVRARMREVLEMLRG